jgi:hypothetical protein
MENNFEYLLFVAVLALMAREYRRGREVVRSDATIQLKGNERFRTITSQVLDPVFAVAVVGSILLTDLEHSPSHWVAALVGAAAGYAFGAYRARITFVASVPAHKGMILRYSLETVVTLALLVIIKLVAERDLLPEGGIFRLVIAGLLGLLLVESAARVLTLVRYYRRDEAAAVTASQPGGV